MAPKSQTQKPVAQKDETPKAPKATPQRKDGTGPDPKALREGRMNPNREGKVFQAIRDGAGSTTAELMAATGLRNPTVRFFGISAGEAGIIEAIRIGATYHFVVTANDAKASAKAREVRKTVLAARDAAVAEAKASESKQTTPAK